MDVAVGTGVIVAVIVAGNGVAVGAGDVLVEGTLVGVAEGPVPQAVANKVTHSRLIRNLGILVPHELF
jgi:hypothetical protein